MSSPTPGPWIASEWIADVDGEEVVRGWQITKDGSLLPLSDAETDNYDEATANARLIAAAPQLLKELESMCSVWVTVCNSKGWDPEHMSQYVEARAAIKAAKGEA